MGRYVNYAKMDGQEVVVFFVQNHSDNVESTRMDDLVPTILLLIDVCERTLNIKSGKEYITKCHD